MFGSPNRGSHITVMQILENDLSRNMALIFSGVKAEVYFALPLEFLTIDNWSPVELYPRIVKLMARTSGRTFSGETLCRNEEWLQLNCDVSSLLPAPFHNSMIFSSSG